MRRWIVLLPGLALVALALWQLEGQRAGLEITTRHLAATPVTRAARPGAEGPVVVVAHGFAGSRQMMQGYSLDLARAGYRVWAFDFEGHGRNPVPMSGDVESIDGTTRLLIAQTRAVVDAAVAAEGWDGAVALLGWGLGVFGAALDRYGANFWSTPERLAIIAALALGLILAWALGVSFPLFATGGAG
jgi:pimeloyl-ACP methyl ester carboxylesterase